MCEVKASECGPARRLGGEEMPQAVQRASVLRPACECPARVSG